MSGVEFALNWFYADDRDIAFFSSGRLPQRAPGTDPALPTAGTGEYDWRGYLPFAAHARAVNPASGTIVNWNNRPAPDVGAGDSNFAYGPVQRVELLTTELAKKRTHTLASVTAAMNRAATQDLRATLVWPLVRDVLRTSSAPTSRADAAAGLIDAWVSAGGSRLDADLDGRIDAPGAAVLDAAWPGLADAIIEPLLGPLTVAPRGAQPEERRPRSGRLRVRRRVVRIRGQGPAHAPRASRARRLFAALLRRRGSGRLSECALGGARSRRSRARGGAGPGSVDVAGGRDARADPLHVDRVPGLDALDESADVPAAAVVLRPPSALSSSRCRHRR